MGMTDSQYKGKLLDELEVWNRVVKMAAAAGNEEIRELAQEQIDKINAKLKL